MSNKYRQVNIKFSGLDLKSFGYSKWEGKNGLNVVFHNDTYSNLEILLFTRIIEELGYKVIKQYERCNVDSDGNHIKYEKGYETFDTVVETTYPWKTFYELN